MKGMNKRGQELSVGTLILIVLGIVLLVLLILGFSLGWSNLWEKIGIFSSSTSLESVAQKCTLAVTSSSLVSYCETFSQVTVDGNKMYINCEYGKLSLDKKLTCAPGRDIEKCKDLLNGRFSDEAEFIKERDKLTVNGNTCTTRFADVTPKKAS